MVNALVNNFLSVFITGYLLNFGNNEDEKLTIQDTVTEETVIDS